MDSREKPTLIYSLDVLRLDSSNSSLNHLSSRMSFACETDETNRANIGSDSSSHQTPESTPAPGVFRRYREHSNSLKPSWVHPHSSAARVSVLIDDVPYAFEHSVHVSQASEEDYRRRKHVCPICLMRFKRPSGLQTHLNSHTGATRKFPNPFLAFILTNANSLLSLSLPIPKMWQAVQCQIQHVKTSSEPPACWAPWSSEYEQEGKV